MEGLDEDEGTEASKEERSSSSSGISKSSNKLFPEGLDCAGVFGFVEEVCGLAAVERERTGSSSPRSKRLSKETGAGAFFAGSAAFWVAGAFVVGTEDTGRGDDANKESRSELGSSSAKESKRPPED